MASAPMPCSKCSKGSRGGYFSDGSQVGRYWGYLQWLAGVGGVGDDTHGCIGLSSFFINLPFDFEGICMDGKCFGNSLFD